MTSERFVELLESAASELGLERSPRSYSGRSMYGRQCVGLEVSNDSDLAALGAAMMLACAAEDTDNEANSERLLALLRDTHTDSMGRDIIAYWPKVQVPASLAAEEEADA